jgi:hypothetical protein
MRPSDRLRSKPIARRRFNIKRPAVGHPSGFQTRTAASFTKTENFVSAAVEIGVRAAGERASTKQASGFPAKEIGPASRMARRDPADRRDPVAIFRDGSRPGPLRPKPS